MTARNIDLVAISGKTFSDPDGLAEALSALLGEPFQFARVSYGDELVLHFGRLDPSRSPKLAGMFFGSFMLGLRASHWSLRSGTDERLTFSGYLSSSPDSKFSKPVRSEELESGQLIKQGSVAVLIRAFDVRQLDQIAEGIGLQLLFSDGSSLLALPAADASSDPVDPTLPEIADLELITPDAVIRVGPGRTWSYERRKAA